MMDVLIENEESRRNHIILYKSSVPISYFIKDMLWVHLEFNPDDVYYPFVARST